MSDITEWYLHFRDISQLLLFLTGESDKVCLVVLPPARSPTHQLFTENNTSPAEGNISTLKMENGEYGMSLSSF